MSNTLENSSQPKYSCIRGHLMFIAFMAIFACIRLFPIISDIIKQLTYRNPPHIVHRQLLWKDKIWIPTNNRTFTYHEIADEFEHRCTAFIGDSLTRRLGITLANIIVYHKNITKDNLKPLNHDLDKKIHTSYHWKNINARCFDFIWLPTMVNMSRYLTSSSNDMMKYDTIVFGLAVHDAVMHDVRKVDQKKRYVTDAHLLSEHALNSSAQRIVNEICPYSKDRTIIWRLAPYLWNQNHVNWSLASNARIRMLNHQLKISFASCHNVLLLDHEELLKNVSIGDDRIRGNSHEHFGLEARLASVQSLVYDLKKYDDDYLCPQGYDCIGKSSCPNNVVDCPIGYFCDSYESNPYQDDIDKGYAYYVGLFTGKEVTDSNYLDFVEPHRQIQSLCVRGFYCPNSTSILPCPANYWCAEGTTQPQSCDTGSFCGEMSYYEVNIVNLIIALILSFIIALTSYRLNAIQKKRERVSKSFDYRTATKSSRSIDSKVNNDGVEVVMVDYSYSVIDGNKQGKNTFQLLSHVTAKFNAGSITCVLGPSRCGKSTFLEVIRSKSRGIIPAGSIDIYSTPTDNSDLENGSSASKIRKDIVDLQHFIGFVPQEEVIDRNLTVRELLTLNASIRLPTLTTAEKAAIVEDVMIDLHIRHVADTIIGGAANTAANVSGGQLKRINIAMELVSLTRPALLLLDEPTSGLDAAIANELFENLYNLSRSGITIIAALQQPRQEIFERMDSVVLMSTGGHIVYDGPPTLAAQRLIDHGYNSNPVSADADFCLDVLNGIIELSDIHSNIPASLSPDTAINHDDEHYGVFHDIIISWYNETNKNIPSFQQLTSTITRNASMTKHLIICQNDDNDVGQMSYYDMWISNRLFLRECYLHGQRALTIRLRNWTSLLVYAGVQVIMAVALASGFSIFFTNSYLSIFSPPALQQLSYYFPSILGEQVNQNVFDFGLSQLLFFMATTLGLASALTAVPLFAGKQSLIKRESLAGMSVAAYSIGCMAADIVIVYWNALIYAALWMMFGPAGHWYDWHATLVSIAFASSGWGYFASVISTDGSSSFVALIITLIFCVFSGVDPTLKQVEVLPIVNWPWYLSFATWTSETVYYTVSQYVQQQNHQVASRVQTGADELGFQVTDLAKPIVALLGLGILARVVSFIALQRLRATRKIR